MGQNEAKPLRQRSIYLEQIECHNKNKVITGIMVKAQKQVDNDSESIQKKSQRSSQKDSISGKLTHIKNMKSSNPNNQQEVQLKNSRSLLGYSEIQGKENRKSESVISSRRNSSNLLEEKTNQVQNRVLNSNNFIGIQILKNNSIDQIMIKNQQQMQRNQNIKENGYPQKYHHIKEEEEFGSDDVQSDSNNIRFTNSHRFSNWNELQFESGQKPIRNAPNDSSNNQISNYHKTITDTIQKESQINSSFQTYYRESVRTNNRDTLLHPIKYDPSHNLNNINNNSNSNNQIPDRFSISSAQQRRLSTRHSIKEQELLTEGLLRRQSRLQQPNSQIATIQVNNCDFLKSFMNLPEKCQRIIFYFLFYDQFKLKQVNSLFYYKIQEFLDQEMVELDNSFIKNTMTFLSFKDSYLTQSLMKFHNNTGLKSERHIIAEVLPQIKGYNVKISFSCKYANSLVKKKNTRYLFEYQFDAVTDKKVVWALKEECKVTCIELKLICLHPIFLCNKQHNFDLESHTFVQPITPVRVGDNIKITINFQSLAGMLDLRTIRWNKPVFSSIPKIPIMLDPNELESYNPDRVCEIELLYTSWVLFNYFHSQQKCKLDFFEPFLHLKETRCAGIDLVTSKLIFQAQQPGVVPKSYENFGVKVKVVEKGDEAVCSVKKMGLFSDNESQIELRVGDIFIFYIAKGD